MIRASAASKATSSWWGRVLLWTALTAVAAVVGAVATRAIVDWRADASAPTLAQRLEAVSGPERTPLPAVTLPALSEGDPVDLSAYRGQPLVINFWATWCAPCVEEMPALERVATALRGRVAVLGVNVKDNPDAAIKFLRTLSVTYEQAIDPQGEFFTGVRGFGLPTTLLVDPSGAIVYRRTGALSADEFRALIRTHLGVQV